MADPKDEQETQTAEEPKASKSKSKSASSDKPVVAPDGHENLSQADIDARG